MKLHVSTNHQRYLYLFLSISFALLLVLLRMKITQTGHYFFLVWNLFLAGIPFLITKAYELSRQWHNSAFIRFLTFLTWLLFLPNSPYIITDLVHLHNRHEGLIWFDLFLVFVFAINGLILGLLSLLDMAALITERYGKSAAAYSIFKVCLLSGFGIYLGRFLRFNSWDVVTKPKVLLVEIMQSLQEPKVWVVTLAFGGFLWILFLLGNSIKEVLEVRR